MHAIRETTIPELGKTDVAPTTDTFPVDAYFFGVSIAQTIFVSSRV